MRLVLRMDASLSDNGARGWRSCGGPLIRGETANEWGTEWSEQMGVAYFEKKRAATPMQNNAVTWAAAPSLDDDFAVGR